MFCSDKSLNDSSQPTAKELRLPSSLHPIWYNLTLRTHLPGFVDIDESIKFTFDARLLIRFTVNDATDRIVLSVRALNLSTNADDYKLMRVDDGNVLKNSRKRRDGKNQTTIVSDSATTIRVRSVIQNETVEMVTFMLNAQLMADSEYIFEFRYAGPISRSVLAGLYVSQYKNINGETRFIYLLFISAFIYFS